MTLLGAIAAPFRKSRRSSTSTRSPHEKLPSSPDSAEKQHTHSLDRGRTHADNEKEESLPDEYADKDEIHRAHEDSVDRLRYMRVIPREFKDRCTN